MSESLTTPTALIFGATGGIGSALARRLSAEKWRVALSARGRKRLEALGNELGVHTEAADATYSPARSLPSMADFRRFNRASRPPHEHARSIQS